MSAEILRAAQKVLVRSATTRFIFRPKHSACRARYRLDELRPLVAAGLIELGPRHRWARLTAAGRQALEEAR